jgi:hypothetical protein
MRLFELKKLMAQETRRAASTTRRKIGSSTPEGLERRVQRRAFHCGAVAGKSSHAPMT